MNGKPIEAIFLITLICASFLHFAINCLYDLIVEYILCDVKQVLCIYMHLL